MRLSACLIVGVLASCVVSSGAVVGWWSAAGTAYTTTANSNWQPLVDPAHPITGIASATVQAGAVHEIVISGTRTKDLNDDDNNSYRIYGFQMAGNLVAYTDNITSVNSCHTNTDLVWEMTIRLICTFSDSTPRTKWIVTGHMELTASQGQTCPGPWLFHQPVAIDLNPSPATISLVPVKWDTTADAVLTSMTMYSGFRRSG